MSNLALPKTLAKLLREIDDKIEEKTGCKYELNINNDYNSKYTSLMSILYTLDKYLDIHPKKYCFIKEFNVSLINSSNLILKSNFNKDIDNLCALILILATLSNNNNAFIDRISNLDDSIGLFYINTVEDYIAENYTEINENAFENDNSSVNLPKDNKEEIKSYIEDTTNFNFNRRKTRMSIMKSELIKRQISKVSSRNSLVNQSYFANSKFTSNNRMFGKSSTLNSHAIIEQNDKDSKIINSVVDNYEKQNNDLKIILFKYKEENLELINKIRDLKSKLEKFKQSEEDNLNYIIKQDQTEEINNLKALLNSKESEAEEIKKELTIGVKRYIDEIHELQQNLKELESVKIKNEELVNQTERLNNKLKEIPLLKKKIEESNSIKLQFEGILVEAETFKKEKNVYSHKLELAKNDIIVLNEKIKQLEGEKVSALFEIEDLKREKYMKERQYSSKKSLLNSFKVSFIKDDSLSRDKKPVTENTHSNFSLYDAKNDKSNFILLEEALEENKKIKNMLNNVEKKNNEYKSELETIRIELDKSHKAENIHAKLSKSTKAIYEKKVNDNNDYTNKLNNKIKSLEKEIDQLIKDKKELKTKLYNIDIELAKDSMKENIKDNQLNEDVNFLKAELNDIKNQLSYYKEENNKLIKEKENNLNIINNNNSIMNKILDEKMAFLENESKTKEIQKNKSLELQDKINSLISSNEELNEKYLTLVHKLKDNEIIINKLNFDVDNLKQCNSEYKNKIDIQAKDIKDKETSIKSLISQIKENNQMFNIELEKRLSDIKYYKNISEEQQIKFAKENDVVLNNLYELALQFNTLKNEYDKKCLSTK